MMKISRFSRVDNCTQIIEKQAEDLEVSQFEANLISTLNAIKNKEISDDGLWRSLRSLRDGGIVNQRDEKLRILRSSESLYHELFLLAQSSVRYRPFATKLLGELYYFFDDGSLAFVEISGNDTNPASFALRCCNKNESQYIKVALNIDPSMSKAFSLWNYRRNNAWKGIRWWWELGIGLLLRTHQLKLAVELSREIEEKFGNIGDQTQTNFISHLFRMGKTSQAVEMYDRMYAKFGTQLQAITQREANSDVVLNKKIKFVANLKTCLRSALTVNNLSICKKIVSDIQSMDVPSNVDEAVMLLELLTGLQLKSVFEERLKVRPTKSQLHKESKENVIQKLNGYVSTCINDFPEAAESPELYRIWMDRLSRIGALDDLLAIFQTLLSKQISLNDSHMHSILKALLSSKTVACYAAAEEILQIMEHIRAREMAGERLYDSLVGPPVAAHYGLFIKHFSRRGQKDMVYGFLQRMRVFDITPDSTIFNALIDNAKHEQDFELIWDIYISMKKLHVRLDAYSFIRLWKYLSAYYKSFLLYGSGKHDNSSNDYCFNRLSLIDDNMENMAYRQNGKSITSPPDCRMLLTELASAGVTFPISSIIFLHVFEVFIMRKDFAGCICAIEICDRIHQQQLNKQILDGFLKIFSHIVAQKKAAAKLDIYDNSDGCTDKQLTKMRMIQELLCETGMREEADQEIQYHDLAKLIISWAGVPSKQLLSELENLRTILGLDDGASQYHFRICK